MRVRLNQTCIRVRFDAANLSGRVADTVRAMNFESRHRLVRADRHVDVVIFEDFNATAAEQHGRRITAVLGMYMEHRFSFSIRSYSVLCAN